MYEPKPAAPGPKSAAPAQAPVPHGPFGNPPPGTHRIHLQLRERDNPFVRHHVIGTHPVLPATATLNLIANACEDRFPGFVVFRVQDYRILKGILFDDSLANPYILDLVEMSGLHQPLVSIEATLWHMGPGGRPRYNYRGVFTLREKPPPPPRYPFLMSPVSLCGPVTCYRDGTLFHGPFFAGIQRTPGLDRKGLIAECRSMRVPVGDQGQFPVGSFNMFAADVAFQAISIWTRYAYDSAGLPAKLDTVELFRSVPFEETYYVFLDVRSSDTKHVRANMTQYDEMGVVYARYIGVHVTLNKALNALFAEGAKHHP